MTGPPRHRGAPRRPPPIEEAGARVYVDEVLDADVEGNQVHFALRDAMPG